MMIRYLWPALLWSIIVLVLTLIPGDSLPEVDIFQVDKLVHFLIFGILMILSSYGLTKIKMKREMSINPHLMSGVYSIGFGIMIEFIQRFVPGRSFSIADMIANAIGVALGYFLFIILEKRKLF